MVLTWELFCRESGWSWLPCHWYWFMPSWKWLNIYRIAGNQSSGYSNNAWPMSICLLYNGRKRPWKGYSRNGWERLFFHSARCNSKQHRSSCHPYITSIRGAQGRARPIPQLPFPRSQFHLVKSYWGSTATKRLGATLVLVNICQC